MNGDGWAPVDLPRLTADVEADIAMKRAELMAWIDHQEVAEHLREEARAAVLALFDGQVVPVVRARLAVLERELGRLAGGGVH